MSDFGVVDGPTGPRIIGTPPPDEPLDPTAIAAIDREIDAILDSIDMAGDE